MPVLPTDDAVVGGADDVAGGGAEGDEAPVAEASPPASEPPVAEPASPAPPRVDPAPFGVAHDPLPDDETTVDDVVEPNYSAVGEGAPEDTTDDAWGGSVWREDSLPPTPTRELVYEAPVEPPAPAPPAPVGGSPLSRARASQARAPEPFSAPPQDAPIAQDLYGGYGDFDGGPPPTEEVPSSVMEDIGTSYNAPMHVPEPPPIPGILDRFTPPPVERSPYSQPQVPSSGGGGLPSYLDPVGPGAGAGSDSVPPPPSRRKTASMARPEVEEREERGGDEGGGGGFPIGIALVGLALMAVLVVGVLGVGMVMLGAMSGGGGTAEGPREDVNPPGVEVRTDMNKKQEIIGADAKPAPEEPAPEPVPAPGTPDPSPAPAPAPAPGPAPAPAPTPTPKPPPPTPAPAPAAAPKKVGLGVLKVTANRRVLVTVDGKAAGYTPFEGEFSEGSHEVSATIPGQPASKRTETAKVGGPGSITNVKFAF